MPSASILQGAHAPVHALVTGASRGIGLALVRALLDGPGIARVDALARHATGSGGLDAIDDARIHRIDIDLADADAIAAHGARLQRDGACVQLVVNAAGLLHAEGVRPEKTLDAIDADALHRVFALNAFAPILLARALQPVIPVDAPAVFASLSARVGSIGDNARGGWYAYRASKAAQNQLIRTLALEWRRVRPRATCLLLHPGTVDTDLSRPFQARVPASTLFDADTAARHLLARIAEATPADSGRFIAWDGQDIAW